MPFIPANESLADVRFPLAGVDVSCEFERQPPLTTPAGKNVRGFEPGSERGRGGARPGLVKFIPAQVDGGAHLVQHLNTIVTADGLGAGLLTGESLAGGYATMLDPSTGARNPGRRVRVGGSGRQPNRHVATQVAAAPTAVGDTGTAVVGGPAVDINVLANDAYSGVPTITITNVDLGTAVVVGSGASSKIRYTPPPGTGPGGFAHIDYNLTGSQNSGVSTAQVVCSVDANLPPGDYPGKANGATAIIPIGGRFGNIILFQFDGWVATTSVVFQIDPIAGPAVPGFLGFKVSAQKISDMRLALAAAGVPILGSGGDGRMVLQILGPYFPGSSDGDMVQE